MKHSNTSLPIRILGDDILRQKAAEVAEIDAEIKEFAQDLIHTMYIRDGVGLAAPQVGKSIRMFVIDPEHKEDEDPKRPLIMINPIIEESSGEITREEGCISVPDIFAEVKRSTNITVSYTDLEGVRQQVKYEGFAAVVVQHEYDHLDGVLFIDKITALSKLKHSAKIRQLLSTAKDGVNILEHSDEDG